MQMNGPIACVTGASGTVGIKITAILLSQGYKVRVLSRKVYPVIPGLEVFKGDINNGEVLKNFLQSSQMLFHCAAELKDVSRMWEVNVTGTERIIKYAESFEIKYFCYLSSVGVIGNTDLKLVDESTPCNPQNAYEKSKWTAEQIVIRGIKGCKVVILRPTNVVDEENPGMLSLFRRNSWIDLCKVFLIGGECAHIVHSEDVADAAVYFISNHLETVQCYIVSTDEEPLNTSAELLALYNAYHKGRIVDTVSAMPHLPLRVPYILRKFLRGSGNSGDVRYSSKKLLEAGFVFKLGAKGAVYRIASESDT